MAAVPDIDRSTHVRPLDLAKDALPAERALGIHWDVENDSFGFSVDIGRLSALPHTRRGVLSAIASIYDPLGVLSPCIMTAKILLQELSRMQVGWDSAIPSIIQRKWDNWLQHLPLISEFKVRRCLKSTALDNVKTVELHHFADASEKGYGTVSYIRFIDINGRLECTLLGSKTRLAPIKSLSIPRLELSAAALAVKVNHSIVRALRLPLDQIFFWTDSIAVLKYIRNVSSRFHVFVANRLAVIHDGSKPEQWKHVRSSDNPADCASRGQVGETFVSNKLWKDGPQFLWEQENFDVAAPTDVYDITEDDPEVKKIKTTVCMMSNDTAVCSHPIRTLMNLAKINARGCVVT